MTIKRFMKEHQHSLLGIWGLPTARKVERLFAIVIAEADAVIDTFEPIAIRTYDRLAWGRLTNGELARDMFRVKHNTLPVVVVLNVHFMRYRVLPSARPDTDLETFLEMCVSNKTDVKWKSMKKPKEESQFKEVIKLVAFVFALVVGIALGLLLIIFVFVKIRAFLTRDSKGKGRITETLIPASEKRVDDEPKSKTE
jgi:hypothetical protein